MGHSSAWHCATWSVSPPSSAPYRCVTPMGRRTFALGGGGGHGSPRKLGGGGAWKRAPVTRTISSIGTKGARRKIWSTMVYVKRAMHACKPHVARMMQCMVLTRVYALSNMYAVTVVT